MNDAVEQAQAQEDNHISTVRKHLLDQMRALRSASSPDQMKQEIERSKGIAELAQAVVNTAKVEVDYLKATGQSSTPFLEVPITPGFEGVGSNSTERLPGPGNGITSIVRHKVR